MADRERVLSILFAGAESAVTPDALFIQLAVAKRERVAQRQEPMRFLVAAAAPDRAYLKSFKVSASFYPNQGIRLDR